MSDHGLAPEWRLENRTALPDTFRVLLAEYPREIWPEAEHFHGHVSFWLDRHLMFRRILDRLSDETEAVLDRRTDPDLFGRRLARLGSEFVNGLHGHHTIEDRHFFPVLAQMAPQVGQGFTLLDADHQAIDGVLQDFVERANAALHAPPETRHDEIGRFRTGLSDLESLLDRHLQDEEELVVPVILKYGPDRLP